MNTVGVATPDSGKVDASKVDAGTPVAGIGIRELAMALLLLGTASICRFRGSDVLPLWRNLAEIAVSDS
ncbi:hypothetical protein AB4Y64_16305 [Lysobacter sp. TAF61]|uniref:hypothetical protein n=1 Tax=Lysobacter sp. TAF61 TaxID=3233072 RepID=UPI003F95CBBF